MQNKSIAGLVAASVSITALQSCRKGEEDPFFSLRTRKARLTGEWEVKKYMIDNEDVFKGTSGVTIDEFTMEFEKDGDYKQTFRGSYNYSFYGYNFSGDFSYSYSGEWEFEDKKETLEIIVDGQVQEFDIIGLSNKDLILEGTVDGSLIEIEGEKN